MVVSALADAAGSARFEQGLDSVEQLHRHQRLARTGVFDTHPHDDAHVELVVEHFGQPRHAERHCSSVAGASVRQPVVGHLVAQALQRVVAGGIQLEVSADQRRSLGIGNDVRDRESKDGFAHVDVAQRRIVREATHLGLLPLAFRTSAARLAE